MQRSITASNSVSDQKEEASNHGTERSETFVPTCDYLSEARGQLPSSIQVEVYGNNSLGLGVYVKDFHEAPTPAQVSEESLRDALKAYYQTDYFSYIERQFNKTHLEIANEYIDLEFIVRDVTNNNDSGSAQRQTSSSLEQIDSVGSENRSITFKEFFSTQQASKNVEKNLSQILLMGQSGAGKTSACKRILHEWLKRGLWSGLFDWVIFLPLPEVREYLRRNPGASVGALYAALYFTDSPDNETKSARGAKLHQILQNTNGKVLYILEAWDTVCADAETVKFLSRNFFTQKNLIISSRTSNAPLVNFGRIVEVKGFKKGKTNNYLELDAVAGKDQEKSKEIRQIFIDFPDAEELAQVPICMDMICLCSDILKRRIRVGMRFTTTLLWQTMAEKFWTAFLLRDDIIAIKRLEDKKQTIASSQLKLEELLSLVQQEKECIECIAYHSMLAKRRTFDKSYLDKVTPISGEELSRVKQQLLFITASNHEHDDEFIDYKFPHPLWQEFHCAQRVVAMLESKDAALRIEANDFIVKKKYDFFYFNVMQFIMGILSARVYPLLSQEHVERSLQEPIPETSVLIPQSLLPTLVSQSQTADSSITVTAQALREFWRIVYSSPMDIVGITHFRLVISCLMQAANHRAIPDLIAQTEYLLNFMIRRVDIVASQNDQLFINGLKFLVRVLIPGLAQFKDIIPKNMILHGLLQHVAQPDLTLDKDELLHLFEGINSVTVAVIKTIFVENERFQQFHDYFKESFIIFLLWELSAQKVNDIILKKLLSFLSGKTKLSAIAHINAATFIMSKLSDLRLVPEPLITEMIALLGANLASDKADNEDPFFLPFTHAFGLGKADYFIVNRAILLALSNIAQHYAAEKIYQAVVEFAILCLEQESEYMIESTTPFIEAFQHEEQFGQDDTFRNNASKFRTIHHKQQKQKELFHLAVEALAKISNHMSPVAIVRSFFSHPRRFSNFKSKLNHEAMNSLVAHIRVNVTASDLALIREILSEALSSASPNSDLVKLSCFFLSRLPPGLADKSLIDKLCLLFWQRYEKYRKNICNALIHGCVAELSDYLVTFLLFNSESEHAERELDGYDSGEEPDLEGPFLTGLLDLLEDVIHVIESVHARFKISHDTIMAVQSRLYKQLHAERIFDQIVASYLIARLPNAFVSTDLASAAIKTMFSIQINLHESVRDDESPNESKESGPATVLTICCRLTAKFPELAPRDRLDQLLQQAFAVPGLRLIAARCCEFVVPILSQDSKLIANALTILQDGLNSKDSFEKYYALVGLRNFAKIVDEDRMLQILRLLFQTIKVDESVKNKNDNKHQRWVSELYRSCGEICLSTPSASLSTGLLLLGQFASTCPIEILFTHDILFLFESLVHNLNIHPKIMSTLIPRFLRKYTAQPRNHDDLKSNFLQKKFQNILLYIFRNCTSDEPIQSAIQHIADSFSLLFGELLYLIPVQKLIQTYLSLSDIKYTSLIAQIISQQDVGMCLLPHSLVPQQLLVLTKSGPISFALTNHTRCTAQALVWVLRDFYSHNKNINALRDSRNEVALHRSEFNRYNQDAPIEETQILMKMNRVLTRTCGQNYSFRGFFNQTGLSHTVDAILDAPISVLLTVQGIFKQRGIATEIINNECLVIDKINIGDKPTNIQIMADNYF